MALLRDWAHGPLGLRRLVMRIHEDNAPSRRVAERAGFRALPGGSAGPLVTFVHARE